MALELPLYVVNGEKIASFEATEDGRADMWGWDFARGELTRAAASIDDFFGGDPESYQITGEEFYRRLEELRGGREAQTTGRKARRPGPPEPLTRRRGKVTEVSNLERSIREGAGSAPCGENCGKDAGLPEEVEKAREVVKKIYGEDDPAR